jgi:hypothetical protein
MVMKSTSVISCLVVLSVLLALMVGCSKEEEAPPLEEEATPQTSVQAAEPEAPAVTPSPDMEKFLAKVSSMRQVGAGHGIREFFDFQQQMLHNPRIDMKIYIDVIVEDKWRKDHEWKNMSNREFLDSMCREYDLLWTITEPDTIRIAKKPE